MTPNATTKVAQQPRQPGHRSGCLAWVRRGLTVLLVLALAGVVIQLIATESDRRAYPPPGQLLNVNGHQMHIVCAGEGSPTVILEAGGGHFSSTWAWVQPEVAKSTRVCAYDRAGYGWSEPGPEPRDAQRVADELHTLLGLAGVTPPYVLAGHSVGGIYGRVYNARYPGEVAGLVLVDATHPDNWARQGESIGTVQTMAGVSAVLARLGLMRLFAASQPLSLPAPHGAELSADIASSEYWDTQRADTAAMHASLDQGRAAGALGDMPLEVVMAVDYPEGPGRDTELALQRELAALSSRSELHIVDGARHVTLLTDAEYARSVSEAILRVVEVARTGR